MSASISKKKKSRFRRFSEWLHLWLGLISGIVVFIVCFTAAIWVFRDEIAYFAQPYQRISIQDKPYLPPSVLKEKARQYLRQFPADSMGYLYQIQYRKPGRTAYLFYAAKKQAPYKILHINPYNGLVRHHEVYLQSPTMKFNLFLRAGHRFLWLPQKIGSPVVGSSCILFLVTLITGLIWWYPKKWTRNTVKKSFKIKWTAKWKRLNIDLHNVLGFYSLLVAFALTVTGIVYSFQWFANGYFGLLNGGKNTDNYQSPVLNSTRNYGHVRPHETQWWQQLQQAYPPAENELGYIPSADSLSLITVSINPSEETIYKTYNLYFDPYSFTELKSKGFSSRNHSQPYETLTAGQKLIRMNFDIHVGTIGGLPTKILTSLVCLICASLPITGFIVWYNRKWWKRKK